MRGIWGVHGDRRARDNILSAALFLVSGLILLIWPGLSTEIICTALGVVLIALGCLRVVAYFRRPVEIGMEGQMFAWGVILIALGLLVLVNPGIPASILPAILGFCLIADGLFKLQLAVDMKRLSLERWFVGLVFALVMVVLGVIVVTHAFDTTLWLMRFVGASMVVEAIFDLVALFQIRRMRKFMSEPM